MVIPKGNHVVRKGNAQPSKRWGMARDNGWTRCIGTWDRLRWARLQRFATAKDFAAAVGEEPGTYRAIEREPGASKHIELDHQRAFAFAKRLGVRWEWLLLGDGEPWADPDENRERILRAYDEAPADRRASIAEAIEKLLKTG